MGWTHQSGDEVQDTPPSGCPSSYSPSPPLLMLNDGAGSPVPFSVSPGQQVGLRDGPGPPCRSWYQPGNCQWDPAHPTPRPVAEGLAPNVPPARARRLRPAPNRSGGRGAKPTPGKAHAAAAAATGNSTTRSLCSTGRANRARLRAPPEAAPRSPLSTAEPAIHPPSFWAAAEQQREAVGNRKLGAGGGARPVPARKAGNRAPHAGRLEAWDGGGGGGYGRSISTLRTAQCRQPGCPRSE